IGGGGGGESAVDGGGAGSAGVPGTGGVSNLAGAGGTGGSTGVDGGALEDAGTQIGAHLLWTQDGPARIWELDATTGEKLSERTLSLDPTHGSGWIARDFDVLPNGTRRLLWTRGAESESLLSVLGANYELIAEIANNVSDSPADWYSMAYTKLPDATG